MMSMNHSVLFGHAVRLLDTFDKEMVSLDAHVSQYMKHHKITNETDQAFLVEVFSGCIRYSTIMKTVVDSFYHRDGKKFLRSEKNIYTVLCYLALFRLDELGLTHYKKFVQNLDIRKMIRFFTFFFNDEYLFTWMKDSWEKDYDQDFVNSNIVNHIKRWLPELQDLLDTLVNKLNNEAKPKVPLSVPTEVQPFSLTAPKPKNIPFPEPIPKLAKFKPVPKAVFEEPVEFNQLLLKRQENRQKAEKKLMEASRIQFACANPEKSEKTKKKISNILTNEESKLNFDKKKALPKPSFLEKEVPVKLNTATILRDGVLYKKLEEKEIARLKKLEAGAGDSTRFLEWQSEMRKKDLEAQLADIEKRRLTGKLSYEESILAKQNVIIENKKKVQAMKEEAQQMMREYLERKFREEQEMKQLLENTMQGHKNAKEAKRKLQEYKQKIVQQVNEESRELMKRALEETEIEMRRKMELIQQIRAMEAVPANKQKLVDLTSTAGYGLLNEMSIAELRERLALLKTANEEAEELKRDEILESKQNKDQLLLDTLETISKHRTEQMRAAAIKFEEKKKSKRQKPEKIKDDKLAELQKQLEEKRMARLQAQGYNKVVPTPESMEQTRQLLNQKQTLEESRWRELELTRERLAKKLATSKMSNKLLTPDSTVMAS